MRMSHVRCAVGEGGGGSQRPEHLQHVHVKTFFHVAISPYEMKISSSVWMSFVARRDTPCRSRHSFPVLSSLRMTIGVISAFMHSPQQEWFAYCPKPAAGGVAVRSCLSWIEVEDRLMSGLSFGGIQYASSSASTMYWSLS